MGYPESHVRLGKTIVELRNWKLDTLYAGPAQRWTIFFSNGLEYYNTVETLLDHKVRIFKYPVVDFAAMNWKAVEEVAVNESHKFWLHNLKWIEPLVNEAVRGGENKDAALELATKITKSWWQNFQQFAKAWREDEFIWTGHAIALRATTLIGLSELLPNEEWLHSCLEAHLESLLDDFDGLWNHGLVQAIALESIGARFDNDFAMELGRERIENCLEVMVDEQGCINEQATEYARYIERLMRICIKIYKHNDLPGIEQLETKRLKLTEFIGHSLQPDHRFVELGDSNPRFPSYLSETPIEYVLTYGHRGPEIPLAVNYKGGFVFGRSGFGNRRPISEETFYTLRHGPARIIHGHNDHMSLTYWAEGRPVIIDPGHIGYSPGPERDYVRSAEAHNIVVVNGEKHRWNEETSLEVLCQDDEWQSYRLEDDGYEHYRRTRVATFSPVGPFVVLDQVKGSKGSRYISQRWNLSDEFELDYSARELTVYRSRKDGLRVVFATYNVTGGDVSQLSFDFHRGNVNPLRGWRAEGESLVPCPQIDFGANAESVEFLTAVFVVSPGQTFGISYREGASSNALRVNIGESYWRFDHFAKEGRVDLTVAPDIVRPFPKIWL